MRGPSLTDVAGNASTSQATPPTGHQGRSRWPIAVVAGNGPFPVATFKVAPVARQQRVLDVVAHHPERLGVAAVELDLERLGPDLGQAPVERPVAGGVGERPAVQVLVGAGSGGCRPWPPGRRGL